MSALGESVGASEYVALPVRRMMVLAAIDAARMHLDAIAHNTDQPDWRDVEAPDLLAMAAELLTAGAV